MRLINDLGYSRERVEQEFRDTFVDTDGILRWMTNQQKPLEDLLADFRALALITEEVQLNSNLVREKETDEFWTGYFNRMEKETI